MITVGDKTIKQPYVAVDGEWKKVSAEYAMVNGEWKEVFSEKETYTVNIYRYGSLYQTLSVTEGESVTLPSLGVGFATASGSTTTAYNSGATITPTGNMTLYAVFSYNIRLYKYGSLYTTLTSKSQSSKASFTLPTCTVSSGDDAFYGWTTTSGSTTRNYTSGQTITSSGMTLYAIFSYTKVTTTITTATKSYVTHQSQGLGSIPESSLLPVTVNVDGTISWTAQFSNIGRVNSGANINSTEDATLNTVGSGGDVVRITVNGTNLSGKGSGTYAVKAGDTIAASGTVGSYNTGSDYSDSVYSKYPKVTVTYPVGTTTTSTAYRSTK